MAFAQVHGYGTRGSGVCVYPFTPELLATPTGRRAMRYALQYQVYGAKPYSPTSVYTRYLDQSVFRVSPRGFVYRTSYGSEAMRPMGLRGMGPSDPRKPALSVPMPMDDSKPAIESIPVPQPEFDSSHF